MAQKTVHAQFSVPSYSNETLVDNIFCLLVNGWISKKIYEGQCINGAAVVGIKVAQLKVYIVLQLHKNFINDFPITRMGKSQI